jgi:hypothetical protein
MALFGNSQGGILGSVPGYNPNLGILAAALQDAGAQFSGNPGAANHLAPQIQMAQEMGVRNQLAQALNSSDPATRSQAYSTAALMGIDTKPFQQQQAAAALPKLLQSMQPSTQNIPNLPAPLPNGTALPPSVSQVQTPGLGLSDALSQSDSPELQAEYAPQIIQSQIAQQAKLNDPYTLEPGAQRFGPNGQVIASVPFKPTPNEPFNPDGSPNLAFQNYEKAKVAAQQGPAWANVQIAKDKLAMARAGQIDPDTIGFMADQVLAGDKSPFQNLGRGIQGAQNISALRNEVMKRAQARGLGGSDLAALNAEFSGLQAGERTLGQRTANVEMAASEVQQLAPLALQASQAVNRSQFPTLNRIQLAVQQGTGDENVIRLNQAVNGLVNTYARAISPSGTPTVSDKDHAREILESAYSKGQFAAAIDQMGKEIAAARKSPGSVRGEFRGAISGRTPGVASVPDAPTTMPLNPSQLPQKAPPGTTQTKVLGGKTYYLINGQWHQ